jgi:uncharacterized membrane protein YdjX (TVP38/TMEM64 family)
VPDGKFVRIERPTLESFVFEGEETPLLLRKRVVGAIVLAFLLLVIAYFVTAELVGVTYEIDAEPFQDWVADQGAWGPVIYIAFLSGAVLIAPVPNSPLFVAAGLAWGPLLGTVYSLAGMLIGSAVAFFLARLAGRRYLPRLIGSKAALRVDQAAESFGGRVIFWARMMPVLNWDWISYLAGLTAMRVRTYLTWSAAGMVIPTGVWVVAGDGLGHDIRLTIAATGVWVAGIVLSAAYFWWRHRRWKQLNRVRAAELANSEDDPGGNPESDAGETLLARLDR